ncbi:MAG: hypothetical protein ACRCV7_00985 [Culicoidibacterales bacterium]
MNNQRSVSSLLWTVLVVLGIIIFWRQIVFLILFLIIAVIALIAYLYYKNRKNIQVFRQTSQHLYEENPRQETTSTHTTNSTVMDAEYTVKSKEID